MNAPADNGFAALSEKCLTGNGQLGYIASLTRDVEFALQGYQQSVSDAQRDIEIDRKSIQDGFILMGDLSKKPVNVPQYERMIAEGEQTIEADKKAIEALQPLRLELGRIQWANSEMFFSDSYENPNPQPDRAFGDHEARTAFEKRPHEQYKTVDEWKDDKRTVGEVLASAADTVKKAIPLIDTGLKKNGLPLESERNDKIVAALEPISVQAQDLLQRQRPARKIV